MPTHSILPPGAGTPAPGFDEPFDMLRACHERVHRMLALLERLGKHVDANGADEQARQAARDVMRYFDLAAPQHHLDEERHVIPRLAAAGDPALSALAARLQDEHRAMSEGWARVRPLLLSLAEGERTGFDVGAHRAFQDYARLYASHIEAEESAAFPAAEAGMDGTALQAMSQDMAGRRGVG